MAAILNSGSILNSAILDSNTVILDSDTLSSSLRFTQKHSLSTLTLTRTNSIWLKLIQSDLTWWWQPSWILPWVGFRHNVFFSEIHSKTLSLSSLSLTQTNSFWLKLIHSYSSWWWQPSWIVPICIQPFCKKKRTSLIHSDSTWWWQPSWILPIFDSASLDCSQKNFTHSLNWLTIDDGRDHQLNSAMIGFRHYELSILRSLLNCQHWSPHSDSAFKLIQSDSNSFILTQLDDGRQSWISGSMLDSAILVFLSNPLYILPRFSSQHLHKKTSLIHSDSTWWWQLILWIQTIFYKNQTSLIHSDSTWWWQWYWILPWVGFRHNVFCTEIHSKTLSLIHFDSNSNWWQPWLEFMPCLNLASLMMAAIFSFSS